MTMRERMMKAMCDVADYPLEADVLTDAVLDAMREPTEAMVRAGDWEASENIEVDPADDNFDASASFQSGGSFSIFTAMIDAAKEER